MDKNWKVWRQDSHFSWHSYKEYSQLKNKIEFDFYFMEIYDFEFSPTKCIYEMNDCIIEKNDIVVDLGSNIGLFTRLASEKSKMVISIEGSPEYFSCLVENNCDLKNIKFINANIVSENNRLSNTWSANKSPIDLTLKDIFYLYNLDTIDFLKIDIEGGEYSLFRDIDDTYIKRIKKIAIETHDETLNDELCNRLIGLGKKSFYFDWYYGNVKPQRMFYFS
jgi:23S rRNA U2552 (ribose-2'-O)-methylase RlmE/FtsJ